MKHALQSYAKHRCRKFDKPSEDTHQELDIRLRMSAKVEYALNYGPVGKLLSFPALRRTRHGLEKPFLDIFKHRGQPSACILHPELLKEGTTVDRLLNERHDFHSLLTHSQALL